MASPAGRRVSVDSAASPAARPEIATPRVRTVSGESAASLCPPAKDAGSARSDTGASDSEEPLDDSAFHARHAVLEKAERKANKSVYCTAQYRQAVDRARQRQKEQEKALRSHRGASDSAAANTVNNQPSRSPSRSQSASTFFSISLIPNSIFMRGQTPSLTATRRVASAC